MARERPCSEPEIIKASYQLLPTAQVRTVTHLRIGATEGNKVNEESGSYEKLLLTKEAAQN